MERSVAGRFKRPSLHDECLRAAAVGQPELAVHGAELVVGVVRPQLVAGDAALWWDAREPATLTRQLSGLLPDAARREALGDAARQRAGTRYRWDDVAAAYEALLGGLAPNGLPSGPMAC